MNIEKTPTHTVPKFLKEFIEERSTDLPELFEPEIFEDQREIIGLYEYIGECDSEEIHINLPSNKEAYNLFSEELERLESINIYKLQRMELEDIKELLMYLRAVLSYYFSVDKIYDKAKFLIRNPNDYYAFYEKTGSGFESVIYDEEKQLLKTLVNTLSDKYDLMDEYIDNYGKDY